MQSPWKLILNLPLVNFQIYHNMLLPLWTLYTLTSVCIFSILFFIHFLRCWQGEFVYQSKASFVSDHFIYSCDFDVGLRGDIGRNEMLVTLTVYRVNKLSSFIFEAHLRVSVILSENSHCIIHELQAFLQNFFFLTLCDVMNYELAWSLIYFVFNTVFIQSNNVAFNKSFHDLSAAFIQGRRLYKIQFISCKQ